MQKAFTLIELSIVLIIIGLLTAGLLAGRELIAQAAISAQVNQLREYEAAYTTFKVKYGDPAIPGDFDNAAAFLTGATNGDGDNLIENGDGARPISCHNGNYDGEQADFFLQLSVAGLVDGAFDGSSTLGNGYPELAIQDGKGMTAGSRAFPTSSGAYGDGGQLLEAQDPTRRTVLCLFVGDTSEPLDRQNEHIGVTTPENMLSLDTKLDDGQPKGGRFIAFSPFDATNEQGNCLNASPYDAYNLSETRENCSAYYVLER